MIILPRLVSLWRNLFNKDHMEQQLDEELRAYVDMLVAIKLEEGLSPTQARRAALLEMGGVEQVKERVREVQMGQVFETIWQDIRYGIRQLVKNPGFTAVAVLTLALGIGANAALFSVVNGVLLSPLPYPQPEQLVMLHQSKPNFDRGAIPYPNFRDWQKQNQTFSAMAIGRPTGFSLTGTGEAERVSAQFISADFFSVLGVSPLLGRTFVPGEDENGASPIVVISAGFWQRKFAGAPDVLEHNLTLDNKSYTIIGVLPANFNFFSRGVDIYVPIGQWNNPALQSRGAALGLHGVGRLKPGVTLAQAQADMDSVAGGLAISYPDTNRDNGARLVPLKESVVGAVEPILLMLLGAVGFVLLIACVNVGNLLLARSTGRTREFAIRAALGASRARLLRQLLTESLLLALLGGGFGLLIAGWGTRAALSLLPTALPRATQIDVDARVLLFTLAISLLTGILAGLAPMLKSSQWQLSETLKEGGRGTSTGRSRTQGIFVAVEMALAVVLLVGAGLMIRSLNALWNVDPGFRPDNVLTFGLSLPPSMRTAAPEAIRANLRELNEAIGTMPGVQAVSFSSGASPMQGEDDLYFWIDGQPRPASQSAMHMALVYRVEPEYLAVMGIPLKEGRFFTAQDDERSMPVVVIDEIFARKYFGTESPIGKRLNLDGDDDPVQIIGVVGHTKQWSLSADDNQGLQAQLYTSFRQFGDGAMARTAAGVGVIVRSETESPALFDTIRHNLQNRNSHYVIYRPQTMNQVIAGTLAAQQFLMILLNIFAAIALLLASIGLYGVISYMVGQRTHELGIRLALGAQRREVLQLIVNHGMKMAMGGVALGLVVAFALTRVLQEMLYGVSATDPLTFAAIALLLSIVAILACLVPAWRAAKVDPLVALRCE
jgi:predicted permease